MTDFEAERAPAARASRFSFAPADEAGEHIAIGPDSKEAALRLHRRSRERAIHFRTDAVRSPAWDILLSLFIARAEGLDAPLASLCAANRLSIEEGRAIMPELIAAALARWKPGPETDENPRPELTPHGVARMNQFLQRVALSA